MRRFAVVVAFVCAANVGAATFSVTSTADSGPGSLRQAILDAQLNPGADVITFAIGTGVQTITLLSDLPLITETVLIDGRTQPGFAGTPLIEVMGGVQHTFSIATLSSSGTTIRGLAIGNGAQDAIFILSSNSNVIEGNYIGLDATGTAPRPNAAVGVFIEDGSNNLIGGAGALARNVISSNAIGVLVSGAATANIVQGNYVGTDAAGTAALGNQLFGVDVNGGVSATTITGNVIAGTVNNAGLANFGADSIVTGNLIGTNAAGTAALPNASFGIFLGGANNRIGGTTAADRNLISGNGTAGISTAAATAAVIQGNYIGTNFAGTAAIPNANGILIDADTGDSIGGSVAGAGNLISGNAGTGVSVGSSSGTVIAGNLIGTNAAGTAALPNQGSNITIGNAVTNTTIGGVTVAARNVISGSLEHGVFVDHADGTTITGNYIGTDITGASAIPNTFDGILVLTGANTTIGGTTSAARNIISGNGANGVEALNSPGTLIQGNYIGTNAAGNAALGNGGSGIHLMGSNSTIGGTTAGAGNVISGNSAGSAIDIAQDFGPGGPVPATGNVVAGNFLGTNAAGTAALPNQTGIFMLGATNNTIGGTAAAARNVISGNLQSGLIIDFSDNNLIQGNFIGTDAAGTGSLGNGGVGIRNQFPSNGNQIGGVAAGAANRILFNATGVVLQQGTGNAIRRNSISNNTGLGIDLGIGLFTQVGVTPNDPGDADTGANNLQNFPVVTSAVLISGTTNISGTLNSTPSTTFAIEIFDNPVCDPSGNGEGLTFVMAATVTTDASGNGAFNVVVPSVLHFVTTTATDPAGNTSEFSRCTLAVPTTLTISDVTVTEGNSGTTAATFTVTATPAPAIVTTVQFASANGTATAPADYAQVSGTVTFNPGEATKTITVNVAGDTVDENNETFFINLTNPVNAAIGDGQGAGTITDDDTAVGSLQTMPSVFEGMPAVFTITLSVPADRSMTVNYATQDGTAVAPGDYTLTFGSVTFAPGETTKTVSVPTINDGILEPAETFQLTVAGAPFGLNPVSATANLIDAALIPTLSQWMLVLLAIGLAAVALATRRV